MAGKDVSYKFLDALAKSVGMGAETVKQALAEINQLQQQQTQALELAAQGKAPTNHASQQPIFGTANEQMYGHVKIAHEVTNDSTDGVAVSPDAVYAYAPDRATTPVIPSTAGVRIPIVAPDTSIFDTYQATGELRLYNGLIYVDAAVRISVVGSVWDKPIINPALSLFALMQTDAAPIDSVAFSSGVPNWPESGEHSVHYVIPAYTILPGSVYKPV